MLYSYNKISQKEGNVINPLTYESNEIRYDQKMIFISHFNILMNLT